MNVPLVIYGPDGERRVIGTAEVQDNGEITADVTDPEIAELLHGKPRSYSFGSYPPSERHNVFEDKEKP